jgi:pyruvate,water dikinase
MLIIPFNSQAASLETAGGKGANLARLTRAGFNVPGGFILSTSAYRDFVAENELFPLIQTALDHLTAEDAEGLEVASARIRKAFSGGKMSADTGDSLRSKHAELGQVSVAVRSSATTEDLPELSFAGQQDTFLNVQGEEQLIKAVINCWSSLWTARAIAYRLRNGIRQDEAALAVVVQVMVESAVSGILFTANPLTGLLSETVIDATFGLGEALVSGQVEPDHYVVDTLSGKTSSVKLGTKQLATRGKPGGGVETLPEPVSALQTLAEAEISQLAAAGRAIQKEFGTPQDIEWALAGNKLYILQSRPITSLFPVPEVSFDPLIIWFSFGAVQGLVGPITPLGQDTILRVVTRAGGMFGINLKPDEVKVFGRAGERIWVRISDFIRHPLGNRILGSLLSFIEPSVGQILKVLASEPRLGAGTGKLKFSTLRTLLTFALPVMSRLVHNMLFPDKARADFDTKIETYLATAQIPQAEDRFARLAAVVTFLNNRTAEVFRYLIPQFIPIFGPAIASLNLLIHLSGDKGLALEVTRGLPDNVTTEMDLELWETATAIKADPKAEQFFLAMDPAELAQHYLNRRLPVVAQAAIEDFMTKYGMRGVGEIDFGQQRWREDPTPVMHTLQSYLNAEAESAPSLMFSKGEKAALAALEKIAMKVRNQPGGWFKEKLVRAAALRIRLLMGARESPKFFAIRIMGIGRKALLDVGQEFVDGQTIGKPGDLVFLKLAELEELAQEGNQGIQKSIRRDWKALVAERRAIFERELRRRQVPRVLVSDGRAYYEGVGAETDTGQVITGSPVSPGVVIGTVHVVLDPRGTQLIPGEILVCPGTDPAWTPLFMVAGGLITEVGGLMTHGSVVAREYGIPAVVSVHQATTRLKDGQKIKLDGTTGKIILLEPGQE